MNGLFDRPPRRVARYWIAIDRGDEQDYDNDHYPEDGHDGSAEAAVSQLARELQQAIDESGLPACFFRVVARTLVDERQMPLSDLSTHYEDGKVSP